MTKRTSSRSVKDTTSAMGAPVEAEESGPLPTDPNSAPTSKRWWINFENGRTIEVSTGPQGRISYSRASRSGAEVRIYNDATTKTFDAVFCGVDSVHSDAMGVLDVGPISVRMAPLPAPKVGTLMTPEETADPANLSPTETILSKF